MKNSETRSDGPELLAEVGAVGIWCLATLQCLNLFAAIYDRVCECVRQCVFGCAREYETACVCVCTHVTGYVCRIGHKAVSRCVLIRPGRVSLAC